MDKVYALGTRFPRTTDPLPILIRRVGDSNRPVGHADRFGADMQKLAVSGVIGQRAMQDALIATGIEYYNFVNVSNLADFFRPVGGGLTFDLGTIEGLALDQQKGYSRLRDYALQTYGSQFPDADLSLDIASSGSCKAAGRAW